MKLKPISLAEAKAFIKTHHRHHIPPVGWKFGVGVENEGKLVAVGTAGRPVARMLDDGKTLEVNRVCTNGEKNCCSMIYSALSRAAKALGYLRTITYILENETGTSLKASGWSFCNFTVGGSWSRPSRNRIDKAPTVKKQLWEKR